MVMALHGSDVRGDAHAEVRETGFEPTRGLMERWYGESMSEAEARDLADSDADTAGVAGARYFLVERDGEPAACCALLGHGGVGQVEEVYTAAEHRGHGLASAVVRAAVAASHERGDDLVMIMADADDWPQKLYERLGFETVDAYRPFTRKPPSNVAEGKFDEVNLPGRRNPYPSSAARVVGRLAQIPREGGVGDDPDVPGVGLLRARARRRGRRSSPCRRRRGRPAPAR